MKNSSVKHAVNNEMFSIKLSIENLYELLKKDSFGEKERQYMKQLLDILSLKFSNVEKLLSGDVMQNVDGGAKE